MVRILAFLPLTLLSLRSVDPAPAEVAGAGAIATPALTITVANSLQDLSGGLMHFGDLAVVVESIVYGADAKNRCMIAFLEGKTLDGEAVTYDRRHRAARTFNSPAEMRGVLLNFHGTQFILADQVVMGTTSRGDIVTCGYSGYDASTGLAVSVSPYLPPDPLPLCNLARQEVECVPVVCSSECMAPVMEGGQIVCNCETFGGSCDDEHTNVCPSNGLCPQDQVCDNDSSDSTKCKCKPV